ncbi:sulfide/dihydroorotate dehydrogenase-like FAD/NAD-binding protein [Tropicimonas sp. IMCC6043]|uniref:sulfide/dihydroorotate dehydrogenase-like FAD/NAD-binding protein n=1 Tax=Tropicimonas sp. IMCC6043 TaxID=2510645 RepID=UPI00101BDF8B|nr:sulfide/dihydroorotate dehydrogenase-like FAD/NAD-binding protein [Tropicimonas sp. IMCC6043]RYH07937.1 sulfide/dihydroorotate dehydrogenase-like FAD/NAD-binding protein [Tropicimonas sp. IMCC6043]
MSDSDTHGSVPAAEPGQGTTRAAQDGRASGFPIVARTDFSETTFLLEIEHPQMARAAKPGQFVIVMIDEHGERIPLTIADFDREKGTVTLVIQAVGKSSREMQARAQVGATLYGIAGPMGIPSEVSHAKKVICVGGGLGVAPIYPQARAFKEAGAHVIGVVGFRSANLVFWEEKFRDVCDEFIICTDDGSAGIKGMVTDGIAQAIAAHGDIDEVVAIGPPVMMRACSEATRPHGIKTMVSLNPIMVDGTGMCGGCRVRVGGRIKFACVDGPDFDGHEVDYDDLMARLKRYRPQEAKAMERWDENCRMLAMEEEAR